MYINIILPLKTKSEQTVNYKNKTVENENKHPKNTHIYDKIITKHRKQWYNSNKSEMLDY